MKKDNIKFGIPKEKIKTEGVKGNKTLPSKPLDLRKDDARWRVTDLKETFRKAREGQ